MCVPESELSGFVGPCPSQSGAKIRCCALDTLSDLQTHTQKERRRDERELGQIPVRSMMTGTLNTVLATVQRSRCLMPEWFITRQCGVDVSIDGVVLLSARVPPEPLSGHPLSNLSVPALGLIEHCKHQNECRIPPLSFICERTWWDTHTALVTACALCHRLSYIPQ